MLAGLLTYILHKKLKIDSLLSGILTAALLYSINLRVNGVSNVSLFNKDSIFSSGNSVLVLLGIIIVIKFVIDLFFKTEIGYMLIVTGDNETLVNSLGKNKNIYLLIGLMISNGLASLSGALMAQIQGFVDIGMGSSIIVIALAAIIIGETIFKNVKIIKWTTFVLLGAIIYKFIGRTRNRIRISTNRLKSNKCTNTDIIYNIQ